MYNLYNSPLNTLTTTGGNKLILHWSVIKKIFSAQKKHNKLCPVFVRTVPFC